MLQEAKCSIKKKLITTTNVCLHLSAVVDLLLLFYVKKVYLMHDIRFMLYARIDSNDRYTNVGMITPRYNLT